MEKTIINKSTNNQHVSAEVISNISCRVIFIWVWLFCCGFFGLVFYSLKETATAFKRKLLEEVLKSSLICYTSIATPEYCLQLVLYYFLMH